MKKVELGDRILKYNLFAYFIAIIVSIIAIMLSKMYLDNEKIDRVHSQAIVTDDYVIETIVSKDYSNKEEVAFYAVWRWQALENKIEICGAVSFSENRPDNSKLMLSGAKIFIKDKLLIHRLTFFNKVPFQASLIGASANCTKIDYSGDVKELRSSDFELRWLALRL